MQTFIRMDIKANKPQPYVTPEPLNQKIAIKTTGIFTRGTDGLLQSPPLMGE